MKSLCYGDNLEILRNKIQDESIDLPLSYDAVKPGKKGADDLQLRIDL